MLVEALLGGVAALLVLIFVFRSFMALMPLLMAVVAIPTTFLLVWGLTAITDISFIVEFLVSLIGLGVAIDYSLLVVLRWREEHTAGVPNDEAVMRAMQTAGKSVIFSGTTVAIGLLALLVLPGSLPAERGVRRRLDSAGHRAGGRHPVAGLAGHHRSAARLAACGRTGGGSLVDRLGAAGRPSPLDRCAGRPRHSGLHWWHPPPRSCWDRPAPMRWRRPATRTPGWSPWSEVGLGWAP